MSKGSSTVVTEAEARERLCPFKMPVQFVKIDNTMGETGHCDGPLCMAWRWVQSQSEEHGYCGLVGQPFDL